MIAPQQTTTVVHRQQQDFYRIAFVADFEFLSKASDFYRYHHQRNARLSVGGLHRFARAQVAAFDGVPESRCQITEKHYFRGRRRTNEVADPRSERRFNDVLISEGVVLHEFPLGLSGEKEVDVALALEVFEMVVYNQIDRVVLVAGDRDFRPLLRKLQKTCTPVFVLGFELPARSNSRGSIQRTATSKQLLKEATVPILLNEFIDNRDRSREAAELFVHGAADAAANERGLTNVN